MKNVYGMVIAGGKGERLVPLTGKPAKRAKPAVPFAGNWRIIDFVLNNFINSEIRDIAVLTQTFGNRSSYDWCSPCSHHARPIFKNSILDLGSSHTVQVPSKVAS